MATAAATVLTALAGTPALAQDTPQPAQDDASISEIVITGSRIARPETDSPNPVASFSAEEIIQSGRTNLTDFLVRIPALTGSSTSADNAGSNAGFGTVGLNLLNLRNLGTNRTLVLIDGRRHVSSLPGTAAVDINTIPIDLIDRVDVLTGGVSAIYGADGVSGVVNFVMKDNFEGLSARIQGGQSYRHDAGTRFGSITMGKNFADGRGNVALSFESHHDDRLNAFDRPETGNSLSTYSLTRGNGGPYRDQLLNDLRYADSAREGALDVDFDQIPDFTGTGAVYDRGNVLPGGLTQGGSSTPQAGYQGDLQPFNEVNSVNFLSHYTFSDAVKLFAQAKYVRSHAFTYAQPSFDFYTFIQPDNPYIPATVQPFAGNGLLLSRDNFDFGIRGDDLVRETVRTVVGASGDLGGHHRYEASYVYGQTETRDLSINDRLADRYFAALDAVDDGTGRIVCRSSLQPAGSIIDPDNFGAPASTFTSGPGSACRPLNLFGENNASNAAGLDFVRDNSLSTSRITQNVLSAYLSGDLGQIFTLPAGPVRYAVGAEYRRETSRSIPSSTIQAGALADSSQILPEFGSFDVKEAFAELNVPLLQDKRFAEVLELGGAYRYSDYSTVGTTSTWQVNSVYGPVESLRFRGTYSQAVRAPNIGELFGASSGTFEFIDDPCDPTNVNEGSSFRAANCRSLITGLGVDYAGFNPSGDPVATAGILGISRGNATLQEETARTWTAGVVYNPTWMKSLRVSLDWYDIKLKNAINTATSEEVAGLCVDQPTLNNVYCSAITRDPASGFIVDYEVFPQNVAAFNTSGGEAKVTYTYATQNYGTFATHLVVGYLDSLNFTATVGAEVDSDREESYAPKWQSTFDLVWSRGPLTIDYGLNWFGKTRRYTVEQLAGTPNIAAPEYLWYKQKFEHDLYASYDFGKKYQVYAGVNNLFDEEPDVGSTNYPVSRVGRFLYIGAKVRLDTLFGG